MWCVDRSRTKHQKERLSIEIPIQSKSWKDSQKNEIKRNVFSREEENLFLKNLKFSLPFSDIKKAIFAMEMSYEEKTKSL